MKSVNGSLFLDKFYHDNAPLHSFQGWKSTFLCCPGMGEKSQIWVCLFFTSAANLINRWWNKTMSVCLSIPCLTGVFRERTNSENELDLLSPLDTGLRREWHYQVIHNWIQWRPKSANPNILEPLALSGRHCNSFLLFVTYIKTASPTNNQNQWLCLQMVRSWLVTCNTS